MAGLLTRRSLRKLGEFSFARFCSASCVGRSISEIDTPALMLDLSAFQSNLLRMDAAIGELGLNLRPHAKGHKSAELAAMQINLPSTIGICVAKVAEAAALLENEAGHVIQDVLITNEIVAASKIAKLVELKSRCKKLAVCVDNVGNARQLNEAFSSSAHGKLGVYVEVDVGQGRCGVEPGVACANLIEFILKQCPQLEVRGLQCYSGWTQHVKEVSTRTEKIRAVVDKVEACLEAIIEQNVISKDALREELPIITGGGTGTWKLESTMKFGGRLGLKNCGFTEVQPGSYPFMDVEYESIEPCDAAKGHFQQALFVSTTIISDSSSHSKWLVVDAGDKAVHPGNACVRVWGHPELTYRRGGDEHGIIEGPQEMLADERMRIGNTLLLVPGHCDPTINFYSEFHGFDAQSGKVVKAISIDGRGPGQ